MSALGQDRPFGPDQGHVRFAPIAVIQYRPPDLTGSFVPSELIKIGLERSLGHFRSLANWATTRTKLIA
jgi:hypothetical protein